MPNINPEQKQTSLLGLRVHRQATQPSTELFTGASLCEYFSLALS